MVLRSARAGDEDALATLSHRAFRVTPDPAMWQGYYREHSNLRITDTLVEEIDGEPAGAASTLDLRMSLAGAQVPLRGISAVVVAPEYRRRGIADALVREALLRIQRQGHPLAALYAFRLSYYRRFGFGLAELTERIRGAPSQLVGSPLHRNVRRMGTEHQAPIRTLYDAWRAERTGPLERSAYWWEVRIPRRAPEGAVYLHPATGSLEGYLLYEVPAQPGYPAQQCMVRELVAITPEAHRGLIGFLASLGDQYAMIELALPREELAGWLEEFGSLDQPAAVRADSIAGRTVAGLMLRLVDLPRAMAAHPSPKRSGASGAIRLVLSDPILTDQSGTYELVFDAGASIRTGGGTSSLPALSMSIDRLSQVYLGGVGAAVLLRQGLIEGSPEAAALLDRAFAGPEPYLGPLNHF